jgi:uncharacterized membrane protein YphA (DoxX/SURF4 family)
MKVAALIARILLGLTFVIFGLNGFLNFLKGQLPPGLAGDFVNAMIKSHFVFVVAAVQLVGGALLLANRYLVLGLVLLGPVIFNIVFFHVFLYPSGLPVAILVAILWGILAFHQRRYLSGIFVRRASQD